jgi:hypothetical protein
MKIVNLTAHVLNIVCEGGHTLFVPPSGTIARLKEKVFDQFNISADGVLLREFVVPVVVKGMDEIIDLPEEADGVRYVASAHVAKAAVESGRRDVFSPGELVRDEKGVVIGCNGLCRPAVEAAAWC